MNPMTANELRRAFLQFFAERGHTVVPSASLIPHDPDLLFTVAGMVPFKPYFLGEEPPPYTRATTVQKCVRVNGKDDDLEEVGRDHSHLSFFEMLGNFSFGDYFKAEAIPHGVGHGHQPVRHRPRPALGHDPLRRRRGRAALGRAGRRAARAHPAPRADNWWGPPGGPPGPVRPELRDLRRPRASATATTAARPTAATPGSSRSGTSCSCSSTATATASTTELPQKNIDTGAGLERILGVLQGKDSVWEIDVLAPLVEAAQSVTGRVLGRSDGQRRLAADPGRARPHDELPRQRRRLPVERGPGLRAAPHHPPGRPPRLPARRRRTSSRPSSSTPRSRSWARPTPTWSRTTTSCATSSAREEERFRQTLKPGTAILEAELDALGRGRRGCRGPVAFLLHDTHGFPLELTREIALERGIDVDEAGFADGDGRAEAAGQGRPAAAAGPTPTSRPTRSSPSSSGPPSSSAATSTRPRPACWPCVGAEGDDAVDRARPHAVLRRERRPGRRHRHHHAPTPGGPRCSTPSTRVPGRAPPPGRASIDGEITAGPGGRRRHRRRPPRRHPPQPHRHPPAALGAARGARRARQAAGLARRRPTACASTSATTRRSRPTRCRAVEDLANHEILANHAGPPLRDHQGLRRAARRHRVLRRQVRRHRARARGRARTRPSCAAAPTCGPPATSAR